MEEPYILEGLALDLFAEKFELIRNLLDTQNDEEPLEFDLAWFEGPNSEANKKLFVSLAKMQPIGTLENNNTVHLYKPFTRGQIVDFLYYMGYGDKGLGTKFTPGLPVSEEEVEWSRKKAAKSMLRSFKKDFVLDLPSRALAHGTRRPRAAPLPTAARPSRYFYFRGRRFLNTNNNNNNNAVPTRQYKHPRGPHINNNNATRGKPAGKKSEKTLRKGGPLKTRTRKVKSWNRNNNNNE